MKGLVVALILFSGLNLLSQEQGKPIELKLKFDENGEFIPPPEPFRASSLETMKEWVIGTKLWISWTDKNIEEKGKGSVICGSITTGYNYFSRYEYSYALYDLKSGKFVVEQKYRYPSRYKLSEPGHGRSTYSPIQPQESLRVLFPIDWPEMGRPPPGEYELRLTLEYWNVKGGPELRTKITIRNPTDEEKLILEKLTPLKRDGASDPDGQPEIQLPESLKKNTGLGFELMLNRLFKKHTKVEEMTVDELPPGLPELFAPEMALLKYEIMRAIKEQDVKTSEFFNATWGKYPGLRQLLNAVGNNKNNGPLARILKSYKINKDNAPYLNPAPAKKPAPEPTK